MGEVGGVREGRGAGVWQSAGVVVCGAVCGVVAGRQQVVAVAVQAAGGAWWCVVGR